MEPRDHGGLIIKFWEYGAIEPWDHGGPIIKFWEDSGTLDKLELVKGGLMKNAKKHVASDPPATKSLS